MPDPNKKVSTPNLDACDRNVVCLGKTITTEEPKQEKVVPIKECINPCISVTKDTASAKSPKIKDTSAKGTKNDTAKAKPASEKSATAKPTTAKSATTKPASVKSATAKPASAKSATAKPATECKNTEKQAVLNKAPCGPGPTCELARPEPTDAKSRVDKAKPSCIDFEKCEEEQVEEEDEKVEVTVEKLASGCMNYEDCQDLANEEKRKLKEQKEMEKAQKKKEKTQKGKDGKPCPKQ